MTYDDQKMIANMVRDVGDAIANALEQLTKGKWRDEHGNEIKNNREMLHLRDVLSALVHFRDVNPWMLNPDLIDKENANGRQI